MMRLIDDFCGGKAGKRHVLRPEKRAVWIESEASYQVWADCKNCKFSAWLELDAELTAPEGTGGE